jgi:hypothetical protein
MRSEDKASLQTAVFRQTAADPVWLGYWLARHQQTERLQAQQLADKMGVPMDNLALVCLCRTPRSDHFAEDLRVVCRRTGAREEVLAQVLRQEQALHQWTETGIPKSTGWLMAASDRPAEGGEPPPAKPERRDDD